MGWAMASSYRRASGTSRRDTRERNFEKALPPLSWLATSQLAFIPELCDQHFLAWGSISASQHILRALSL